MSLPVTYVNYYFINYFRFKSKLLSIVSNFDLQSPPYIKWQMHLVIDFCSMDYSYRSWFN